MELSSLIIWSVIWFPLSVIACVKAEWFLLILDLNAFKMAEKVKDEEGFKKVIRWFGMGFIVIGVLAWGVYFLLNR